MGCLGFKSWDWKKKKTNKATTMPSRLRKTQELQGHVSHDNIGKQQKHPGGPGSAGGKHHHRIYADTHHPGDYGRAAMSITIQRGTKAPARLATWINCGLWSVSRHGSVLQKKKH